MIERCKPLTLTLVLVVASSGVLWGQQRENTIGVKVDVVGGGTNRPEGFSISGPPRPFGSFIGTNPSIDLTSKGEHSVLDISYALGLSRFHSDGNVDSISQTASLRFSRTLNEKWRLNLTELFMMTPDYAAFNVLRGVVETPEGFRYLLDRVAVRRSNQFNNVTFGADHEVSAKSTLSFSVEHSYTRYPAAPGFQNRAPDQQRAAAEVKYSRRKSERTTWNARYTGSYLRIDSFQSAQSNALSIGFSRRLSPSFVFSASAGPSQGRSPVQSHSSYNASLSLQTLVKSNTFFVYYRHDGAESGLGSISDSRYAGLGIIRPLGRKTTLSIDTSAYGTTGMVGNIYRTSGTSASATVGLVLNRALTLNWGGLYQRQNQSSIYNFEEQRVFVSLRYHNPEPWGFLK